jgi:hypothetical protein
LWHSLNNLGLVGNLPYVFSSRCRSACICTVQGVACRCTVRMQLTFADNLCFRTREHSQGQKCNTGSCSVAECSGRWEGPRLLIGGGAEGERGRRLAEAGRRGRRQDLAEKQPAASSARTLPTTLKTLKTPRNP